MSERNTHQLPGEEAISSAEKPQRSLRLRRLLASVAIGSLIGGMNTFVSENTERSPETPSANAYSLAYATDTLLPPDMADHATLPPQGIAQCPDVSPGALKMAEKLVRNPADAQAHGWETSVKPVAKYEPVETMLNRENANTFLKYEATAKKYNLTVHDATPYLKRMTKDIAETHGQVEMPFSAYLEDANEFFGLYGVTLRVASPDEPLAYGMKTPTPAELETATPKLDIYNLMEEFASLPEEYVRQIIGLKNITIAANAKSGVVAYASPSAQNPEIVINGSMPFDSDVLAHEMYHLADNALCGGATENDPHFTGLNAPGVTYGDDHAKTYEPISKRKGKDMYDKALEEATTATQKCEIKKEIDHTERDISFFDDYSRTNSAEDKADTGSRITDPYGLDQLSDDRVPPRVLKKYEFLIGRLGQAYPALAYYFTGIQSVANKHALLKCDDSHS